MSAYKNLAVSADVLARKIRAARNAVQNAHPMQRESIVAFMTRDIANGVARVDKQARNLGLQVDRRLNIENHYRTLANIALSHT
jgi:hypothetical protein